MSGGDSLAFAGIVLDILGAGVLVWPMFHSTEKDVKHNTYAGYGTHPNLEEAALRERRYARWGFPILILGFLLQAIGVPVA